MPWDFESLKDYFDTRFSDNEKRYGERARAQDEALKVALAAQDRRLEGMNEFRQSINDQNRKFISAETYNAEHKSLDDKVEALTDRLAESEKAQVRSQGAIVGKMNQLLVAILVAAISVSLTFVFTHSFIPTPVK